MAQLSFHFADVEGQVKENDRATITGYIGAWMFAVAKAAGNFSAIEVSWSTKGGRPKVGPTDILVYVVSDVDRSVIEATGGNISAARASSTMLGMTAVTPAVKRALSEVYAGRIGFALKAFAGSAFHEAAHNKSLEGDTMHSGKDGLLIAAPVYASDPTPANTQFLSQHIHKEVEQQVVPQNVLLKHWYNP